MNKPEIALRNISDDHVLSLIKSFHAYGFDCARGKLSISDTTAASCLDDSEGALSTTPRNQYEAVSVVPLDGRHRHQTQLDLQKAGDVS